MRRMQTVRAVSKFRAGVALQAGAISSRYEDKLAEHHVYIREHGEDMPETAEWKWT